MTDKNQQSLLLGKIAAYTEILVKDPSSTIFVSLAEIYRKMGMFEDARQIISKGLDLHPDFSPAYIVLARILCQLENFDGSVAAFERALEFDSESLAALVGYARVQILLGDVAGARELLLNARHLSPADPVINKLLLSLPDQLESTDEPLVAVDDKTEEQVVNSSKLVSSTLADLYLAQGLPEKALDLFQRLSSQNPDDLTLRRRVKDIESQLVAKKRDVVSESNNEQLNGDKDQSVAFVDTVETDSSNIEQLKELDTEDLVTDSVADILNRWLSNIQQRRDNV